MCVIAALLAALTLASCSTVSGTLGNTARLYASEHRHRLPTPAQIAAVPYAQVDLQTPHGHGTLVLGNIDGDQQVWYGKANVILFLRHGRIVKTAGLPQNLVGLHQAAASPFAAGLQHVTRPVTYTETADWMPGYRFGVPITARLERHGASTLTILGRNHPVVEFEEHIDAPAAHWHATNRYWADAATGFIWKSTQEVAPGETLTLVQLKPYRGSPP